MAVPWTPGYYSATTWTNESPTDNSTTIVYFDFGARPYDIEEAARQIRAWNRTWSERAFQRFIEFVCPKVTNLKEFVTRVVDRSRPRQPQGTYG